MLSVLFTPNPSALPCMLCSLVVFHNPWIKQEIHVDLKTMYRVANAMYMPKNAVKENIYIMRVYASVQKNIIYSLHVNTHMNLVYGHLVF